MVGFRRLLLVLARDLSIGGRVENDELDRNRVIVFVGGFPERMAEFLQECKQSICVGGVEMEAGGNPTLRSVLTLPMYRKPNSGEDVTDRFDKALIILNEILQQITQMRLSVDGKLDTIDKKLDKLDTIDKKLDNIEENTSQSTLILKNNFGPPPTSEE
jgi:acylphosphatase